MIGRGVHVIAAMLGIAALMAPVGRAEEAISGTGLIAEGLAAMEDLDFETALVRFDEAAFKSPFDPKLLFAISNAHAALKHEVIAGLYLAAYLGAWSAAPNRESSTAELTRYQLSSFSAATEMVELAADLALSLPDEDRSKGIYSEPTEKQKVVGQVLFNLVMIYDLAAAERLATAYPVGSTLALARAAAAHAKLVQGNTHASEVLDVAERIAKLEAVSPDAHYFRSINAAAALACTMPDVACDPAAQTWEPAPSDSAALTEGLLKFALAAWAEWVSRPTLAWKFYSDAKAISQTVSSYFDSVQIEVPEGNGSFMGGGGNVAFSGFAGHNLEPRRPDGSLEELGSNLVATNPQRAILQRSVPTGLEGETVSLDDPLLGDREAFIRSLAALPATDAVVALADAGRRLFMLSDRIRAP